MLSRILTTAKKYLYTPPETQENTQFDSNTATQQEDSMAATRASGKRKVFGSDDEGTTHVPIPTPKRKSKEISRDEETSESESDEQPIETSSKRRKVDKKNGEAIDSKLVIRNTRPVVEIPAMTSSPVAKSGSPRSPAKKVHRPDVVEISSEEEDDGDEDVESDEEEVAVEEPILEQNQERSNGANTDEGQDEGIAKEIVEDNSASEHPSAIETDDRKENIAPQNGSKPSASLRLGDALPALLPMELFDDDDTQTATNSQPHQVQVKPKKIKFTDFVEPIPKDRRFGSTTFRVSKKHNSKLAPKASLQARSTKEAWLHGRVGKSLGSNRKPFTKGFFRTGK
ncbi:hypothetical protein B0J14DRAFT_641760 [Halenospora varia]|nr:hypothetical protein B0J14DRAFT_641760 [Halenospora varia]